MTIMEDYKTNLALYCDRDTSPIPLDSSYSYLSKLLLRTVGWTLKNNQNLIVAYPEPILRPIPIIANYLARQIDGAVLVFTPPINRGDYLRSNIDVHIKNYYRLSMENNWLFSYEVVPTGILKQNRSSDYKLNVKADLRRASINRREQVRNRLESDFEENNKKVIFSNENSLDWTDTFTQIVNGKNKTNKKFNLHIKAVIIENIDRYINSKASLNRFIDWIDTNFISKDCYIVLHISNNYSIYIDKLKKRTSSMVYLIDKSLTLQNKDILQKVYPRDDIRERTKIDSMCHRLRP